MNAQPAAIVTLELPPDGCHVALSCELRVVAAPPFRHGLTTPVVRRPSTLEVLAITADGTTGAWTVRAIAFTAGEATLPVLAVEVIDGNGTRTLVETTAGPIAVTGRALSADATLAGLEQLAARTTPAWWGAVLGASLLIGTALLLARLALGRLGGAIDRAWAPLRVRRAATRLLRLRSQPAGVQHAYGAIVAAVRLALGFRVGQQVDALTAAELAAFAGRCDLAARERDHLAALLLKTDAVRFGGHLPAASEIAADLGRARALVGSRRFVRRPRAARQTP